MDGLKEQFMMRCCGVGTNLESPGSTDGNLDLGVLGMQLYEKLDQTCRQHTAKVVERLGLLLPQHVKILDPVYMTDKKVVRSSTDPSVCVSEYVLPHFISSSIMDNFHYYNSFHKEQKERAEETISETKNKRFYNNHASHTDSGLMTLVVVTDVPGLEVFDKKEQVWIALEDLLHEYIYTQQKSQDPHAHRRYATIFWADSCIYLNEKQDKGTSHIQATFHRVEKSEKERYSVVFKQRTTPTTTPPRYQEDYEILNKQLDALKLRKGAPSTSSNWLLPLSLMGIACCAVVALAIARAR